MGLARRPLGVHSTTTCDVVDLAAATDWWRCGGGWEAALFGYEKSTGNPDDKHAESSFLMIRIETMQSCDQATQLYCNLFFVREHDDSP